MVSSCVGRSPLLNLRATQQICTTFQQCEPIGYAMLMWFCTSKYLLHGLACKHGKVIVYVFVSILSWNVLALWAFVHMVWGFETVAHAYTLTLEVPFTTWNSSPTKNMLDLKSVVCTSTNSFGCILQTSTYCYLQTKDFKNVRIDLQSDLLLVELGFVWDVPIP